MSEVVITSLHLGLIVSSNVAHLFLHVTDQVVVTLIDWLLVGLKLLNQLLSDVLPGYIYRLHGVRQCITFKDWHRVGNAFTTFSDETCRRTV